MKRISSVRDLSSFYSRFVFNSPRRAKTKKKRENHFDGNGRYSVGDKRVEIESSSACDQCQIYVLRDRGATRTL